jgi:hypothetical protein
MGSSGVTKTLRGFGLDTGFIHYGDLQLHSCTHYDYSEHFSIRGFLNPAVGTAMH